MADLIVTIGNGYGGYYTLHYSDVEALAQTFVISSDTWDITTIQLLLQLEYTTPSPASGNMTLNVRDTSPTGDILGTGTADRTAVGTEDFEYVSFSFSDTELEPGTYCLELSDPNGYYTDGDNYDVINWQISLDAYANGAAYVYYEEEWLEQEDDVMAKVYGDPAYSFDPPLPSGVTLDDEGNPIGTPTGENNMLTVKRLIVITNNNKFWYEDI